MPRPKASKTPLYEERLTVSLDDTAFAAVHDALHRFWRRASNLLPATEQPGWRLEFATALMEVAANIFRHAYAPQQRPASFSLRLCLFPDRAEAVLTDSGVALSVRLPVGPLPDPLDLDVEELPEDGMGLAVAQAALDELAYRRQGKSNVWRLAKRIT